MTQTFMITTVERPLGRRFIGTLEKDGAKTVHHVCIRPQDLEKYGRKAVHQSLSCDFRRILQSDSEKIVGEALDELLKVNPEVFLCPTTTS